MKAVKTFPYLLATLAGVAIIAIAILVKHDPVPPSGEYHWSTLLRNGFGWLAILLQVLTGLALGYRYRVNAFLIGLCLIATFPITAMVEATIYRGSHNMLPFEFVMYALYALPSVGATLLGRFLAKRSERT